MLWLKHCLFSNTIPTLIFLHTHSCFTSSILTHRIIDFLCNSHFTGRKFRSIHSIAFFNQFVEFGVHRHAGIGTISCIGWRDTVTKLKCQRLPDVQAIAGGYTYLARRFPRAKCHRTKHHSQMCTHTQRYFQATSIWLADGPAQTKTEQWDDGQQLKDVTKCKIVENMVKGRNKSCWIS